MFSKIESITEHEYRIPSIFLHGLKYIISSSFFYYEALFLRWAMWPMNLLLFIHPCIYVVDESKLYLDKKLLSFVIIIYHGRWIKIIYIYSLLLIILYRYPKCNVIEIRYSWFWIRLTENIPWFGGEDFSVFWAISLSKQNIKNHIFLFLKQIYKSNLQMRQ